MKVSKATKERVAKAKEEAQTVKHNLNILLARLSEHSGTKRVCRHLERVINGLDDWQRTPHL